MPDAVLVAPLLVAVALVLGGIAKLGSRGDLAQAFADLEVPAFLTSTAAVRALPVVEVLLGVALVVAPAPAYVGVAVVVLLLVLGYLALVARAVARGREVDCDCFGGLADARVSGRTVVRNVVLVVAAGLALADGIAGESALHRLLGLDADGWWWLLATLVPAGFVALLVARPRAAVAVPVTEGDRAGIPYLVVQREDGTSISLPELASLRPQLLVTLSVACSRCGPVTEAIGSWPAQVPELDVRVVTTLPPGQGAAAWPAGVLHDPDDRVTAVLGMLRPSAVLLGADALVAGGPVHGTSAVLAMFEEIRDDLAALRQSAR